MVGPLTSRPDVDDPDGDPLVVGVGDERADEVLSVLSATTTRRVLASLHDDPAPPSVLADRLDTSIQNVQYHVEKLVDAGLVEAAGTTYSEKGREMTVYRPVDRALVFVAGPGDSAANEGLLTTLKRLLGGVGVLGLASLVVERLLGPAASQSGDPGLGAPTGGDGGAGTASGTVTDGGAGAGGGTQAGTEAAVRTTAEEATPAATGTARETVRATETAQETGQATGTAQATGTEAAQTATEAASTTSGGASATDVARDTVAGTQPAGGATEATRMATETAGRALDGGVVDAVAASPGALFFLGGLTALLVVWALYRLR